MDPKAMQNAYPQPEEESEEETPEIHVHNEMAGSMPAWLAVLMAVAMTLVSGYAGYNMPHEIKPNEVSPVTEKQYEYQLKVAQYDHDWRMKVVDSCVQRGGFPIVMNGNVDCKVK